ncbi:sensor histidine kinase [Curtobacterium sp. 22159]|uniref:sensor histidine kinase n=1 Tax=Curtobacterium sp. 22159 TaxID=3453882 RepID=UPI003F82B607
MDTPTTATEPVGDDARWARRRRFARVGRVLPVAVVQIVGTLVASHVATGAGRRAGVGGPPWAAHGFVGAVEPVHVGALGLTLLVAGVLVLPWRWRWPRALLVATAATTIGYALVVSPRGPFVAALTMALVNAWLRGHRSLVVGTAVVSVLVLPSADVALGRSPAYDLNALLLCVAWVTVTIAVAELVRVRVERVAERRRQRAEAERRRAGQERVRIARELHDSVAHSMSLINLQAGVALHLGADLPGPTKDSLANIRDSSRDALVELRTILGVLRSVDGTTAAEGPERHPTAGLDRVPDLVARARAAGVDVTATTTGDPSTVPGVTDRNAFRIVQESITNVMKHAADHRAVVTISVGPDVVDLVVEDHPSSPPAPGRTTTPPLAPSGNGLIGMRERAVAVGGTLTAGPTTDGGWRVAARLPVITIDAEDLA